MKFLEKFFWNFPGKRYMFNGIKFKINVIKLLVQK